MPYQICYIKNSPCCTTTLNCTGGGTASTCTTLPQCMRSLEVYGCTPDLTQGEFNDCCIQGTFVPSGCCCAWVVPAGVCSIVVEVWGSGAGGASGSNCNAGPGSGGGGGGYSRKTIAVLPNDLITLCAGAGGLMGQSGGKSVQGVSNCWCCQTTLSSCSFVRRNGVMCADSVGGACASSLGVCYHYSCGNWAASNNAPGGDLGCYTGPSQYTNDVQSWASAHSSYCSVGGLACGHMSQSGGATFGGDTVINVFQAQCNQYLRWNITCRNSAGIFGPGGDSCSGSTAFNVGLNYGCMTASFCTWVCDRGRAAPPGNFPGGGGGGGTGTCCAGYAGGGGSGASGYIRVYY
jgi:hypothetical protein